MVRNGSRINLRQAYDVYQHTPDASRLGVHTNQTARRSDDGFSLLGLRKASNRQSSDQFSRGISNPLDKRHSSSMESSSFLEKYEAVNQQVSSQVQSATSENSAQTQDKVISPKAERVSNSFTSKHVQFMPTDLTTIPTLQVGSSGTAW